MTDRRERLVIFDFGGDVAGIRGLVADFEAGGGTSCVVDLSAQGRLGERFGAADSRHISTYGSFSRVRDARYLAAAWMQSIPFARLSSGLRIIDQLQDGRGTIWWHFDIALQERAFLLVRLIESARAALHAEGATRWAINGSDALLPWQRFALEAACAESGLTRHRITLPLSTRRTAPDLALRVPEGWLRARSGPVRVGSRRPSLLSLISGRVIALTLLIPLLVVGVLSGIVTAGAAVSGRRLRAPRVLRLSLAQVGVAFRLRPRLRQAAFALGGALALVTVLGLAVFSGWVGRTIDLVVVGSVLVLVAVRVVFAPVSLGPLASVRWAIRPERIRASLRGLRRAVASRRRDSARGRPQPDRIRVLVFIDEGDIRIRRAGGRYMTYLPYLEGVVEVLRARPEIDLRTVHLGAPRAKRPWRIRAKDWWRRRVVREQLRVLEWVPESAVAEAEGDYGQRKREWEQLKKDPQLQRAFQYAGVPLWPHFEEILEPLFLSSSGTVLHQRALNRILDELQPDVIVAYNFEGVFRRWIPVALDADIPVVGVQQALGPYVHGLDRRLAGYKFRGDHSRNRVPTPDQIIVWSERDVDQLRRYGHPPSHLIVGGSLRTDVYVREASTIDRREVLRRLALPSDAQVVGFSAVMKVLGTNLLREDHWVDTFGGLVDAVSQRGNCYLLVKPWPGEPVELIEPLIMELGNERVRLLDSNTDLHNVDVLSALDVLVGTFSSLFSEALLAGVLPVLLDYPEARFYFGPEVEMFHAFVRVASDPSQAIREAIALLDLSSSDRADALNAGIAALRPIFGPLDGAAAERVADAALAAAAAGS